MFRKLPFNSSFLLSTFRPNANLFTQSYNFKKIDLFAPNKISHYSVQGPSAPSKESDVSFLRNVSNLSRITKPTGLWLLYFPCAWSTQLGSYSAISVTPSIFWDPKLLLLFLLGALFMRTAGCIVNDIWDRKIDRLVERTRMRPLAAGSMSIYTAISFLALCSMGGLGVLYQLPPTCAVVALGSVLPSVLYPAMKRITYFPQVVLGLSFNYGALLGYPSVLLPGSLFFDSISISEIYPMLPVILPLYIGGIFWTLIYDTIYAYQDIKDDLKVGVKSTAIRFGANPKKILAIFAVCTILSFDVAGWFNGQSFIYFTLLNGTLFPFLLWQVVRTDYTTYKNCWKMFSLSSYFGLAFFGIILLDSYILHCRNKTTEN